MNTYFAKIFTWKNFENNTQRGYKYTLASLH